MGEFVITRIAVASYRSIVSRIGASGSASASARHAAVSTAQEKSKPIPV
jgi:hypothetical protein